MYFDDMKTNDVSASSKYLIYALHHDSSPHVYIGQSSRGIQRTREHSQPWTLRSFTRTPRVKWVKALQKRGCEYEVSILEECATREDLDEAEMFHIAYLRSLGVPLLNCTDGGGGPNGCHPSAETRAKLSEIRKKSASTPKGRARMAKMSRAYWSQPEAREKKRQQLIGNNPSAEIREKISRAHLGVKKTPEQRARMAAAAKARWQVPGYRDKQAVSQRITHSTPEWRAKAAEWARLAGNNYRTDPEYLRRISESVKATCRRKPKGDL